MMVILNMFHGTVNKNYYCYVLKMSLQVNVLGL